MLTEGIPQLLVGNTSSHGQAKSRNTFPEHTTGCAATSPATVASSTVSFECVSWK